MPKKTPEPRPCHFYGTVTHATPIKGTWLEDEAFCYPHGGMTRRAYVRCEDGELRVVTCGIPDTVFSIPARLKLKGKTQKGYVHCDEEGYHFTPYDGQQPDVENHVPNLDGLPESDLRAWLASNPFRNREAARKIFPGRPKGYLKAYDDLRNYAQNRLAAINLRTEGNIERALFYEDICDRIFRSLPEYAKW